MALIALTIFTLVAGRSLAYPLGWGPGGGDWGFGEGDWGDYWGGNWGSNWCGGGGIACNYWGFGGFGNPPSKSYARENYVRPSWNGPEFGTRNEVTYRPGYFAGPYSPSNSWYHPYNTYKGYSYTGETGWPNGPWY